MQYSMFLFCRKLFFALLKYAIFAQYAKFVIYEAMVNTFVSCFSSFYGATVGVGSSVSSITPANTDACNFDIVFIITPHIMLP